MTTKQKIDYNSAENQEIKGKFVQREVYTCFSYEMDSILKLSYEVKSDLPTYDDIENMYYFDDENVIYKIMENYSIEMLNYINDTYERKFSNKKGIENFINSLNEEELKELCEEFNIDISEEESTPHEIYEWWIVSEFLYRKLKEKGYCVLEWGNNYYWGRCTTGQAILLDYVISKICEEMEILQGQKYDWSK